MYILEIRLKFKHKKVAEAYQELQIYTWQDEIKDGRVEIYLTEEQQN